MTKEEVLQRANDYCNERSYDGETLTDEFKDKFATFYAKRHESEDINGEGVLDDIKFNLDTARSAATKGIATKQKKFDEKEAELNKQIEELNKKVSAKKPQDVKKEVPEEIQKQLDELNKYRDSQKRSERFKSILEIAKADVRKDLHTSFEKFAKEYTVDLEKDDKVQAKSLVDKFQEIFRESIGSIKPLQPKQTVKSEEEYISSLEKVKVK